MWASWLEKVMWEINPKDLLAYQLLPADAWTWGLGLRLQYPQRQRREKLTSAYQWQELGGLAFKLLFPEGS